MDSDQEMIKKKKRRLTGWEFSAHLDGFSHYIESGPIVICMDALNISSEDCSNILSSNCNVKPLFTGINSYLTGKAPCLGDI